MDKGQARKIIQDAFESRFDRVRYIHFLRELLNSFDDEGARVNQGARIPEKFQDHVEKIERVGKYTEEKIEIMLFIVYLKRETAIDRARTMQRNFVAWYLSQGEKDAALVAYVSPDQTDWRFSLVKMDYTFEKTKTGKMKVKEEFTPARRWSFLVGENEKSHTAQSRLVNILADDEQAPTLAELENAFDIETVTKEFFLKYRELFLHTKEALDKVVEKNQKIRADFEAKGVDTVNFSKKLLGQIVFLYFLQKKGWFGVGRDDDWGTGSKHFLRSLFAKKHGDYKNFFNDILEPLFYEALRIDRSYDDDYYSRFNCKIPFLNGGLFDPIGYYDWVHTDILLPNDLFSNTCKTKEGDEGDGILDVFDRYNFTVREDEPLEKEVAIDPELLGKAYERFNAIRSDNFDEFTRALKSGKKGEENKFNKKFGVYYTPREIVHYMCKQSLIQYLGSALDNYKEPVFTTPVSQLKLFGDKNPEQQLLALDSDKPVVSRQDIEDLIEVGELITEHETIALLKEQNIRDGIQKSTEYTALLPDSIRKNAKLIDDLLADITVCDPAVGSGAFPVGMMNEIVRARNVLSVFLNNQERNNYEFKRRCIEHSLYGVDIDPGAVEIAKLRLWLSLVVDEEDIKNIKPLPNLDYRIMQGNSLISEFMGIDFDDDENKNLKEAISALEKKEKEIGKKLQGTEKEQLQFYKKYRKQDKALSKKIIELKKEKNKIKSSIAKKRAEIDKNNQKSAELSEILDKFKLKKEEFLNESNVLLKARLKDEVDNLLIQIFESKLKKEKTDFFNRLKDIRNKYSVVPNENQRNEIIKQEEEKLYKECDFDLEAAEKQLKEFTSGRQIKPFFLWNLYFSEVFHEKGGFDVVIANPPYGAIMSSYYNRISQGIKQNIEEMKDIYKAFFIHGVSCLLKSDRTLVFITPNTYYFQKKYIDLRRYLNKFNHKIHINIGDGVFDSVVPTAISIVQKKQKNTYYEYYDLSQEDIFRGGFAELLTKNLFLCRQNKINADNNFEIFPPTTVNHENVLVLDKIIECRDAGIQYTSNVQKVKKAKMEPLVDRIFYQDGNSRKQNEKDFDLLIGKNIIRYHVDRNCTNFLRSNYKVKPLKDNEERVWFSRDILECSERIIWRQTADKIIAAYDTSGYYFKKSVHCGILRKEFIDSIHYFYLLALLNSKYLNYLYVKLSHEKGRIFAQIKLNKIRQIPIANIDIKEQQPFVILVNKIHSFTKDADYLQNPVKKARVEEYERQIDQLVYELYGLTEEEIKIVEGETA